RQDQVGRFAGKLEVGLVGFGGGAFGTVVTPLAISFLAAADDGAGATLLRAGAARVAAGLRLTVARAASLGRVVRQVGRFVAVAHGIVFLRRIAIRLIGRTFLIPRTAIAGGASLPFFVSFRTGLA